MVRRTFESSHGCARNVTEEIEDYGANSVSLEYLWRSVIIRVKTILNRHTDVHGMSRKIFENYGTCSVSLEYPCTSVIIRVKNNIGSSHGLFMEYHERRWFHLGIESDYFSPWLNISKLGPAHLA